MHYSRTCPNCRQRIDLDLAVRFSGWSKLAPPNFGIRCPNCKVVLAARQRPGLAVFWVVFGIVLTVMLLGQQTGRWTRTSLGLLGLCLFVLALSIRWWRLRSIELSVPPAGLKLGEVTPSTREYAYLENKDDREKVFMPDPNTTENQPSEWTCLNCNQPNPASFGVCWKCNHGRPRNGSYGSP
jgi:hypothetical protein